MKLSDLFTNLADGARNFEARVTKWQEELDAKGADLEAGAVPPRESKGAARGGP